MLSFLIGWKAKLLALGVALVAGALFLLRVFTAGRNAERAAQTRRTLEAVETRHDVEDDVRRAGPGTAADRLREWQRD